LLLVAFLLVNAPNCNLSLVLASVVQSDAVNCNSVKSEILLDTGPTSVIQQDNAVDHKRNENAIAGVARLNIYAGG